MKVLDVGAMDAVSGGVSLNGLGALGASTGASGTTLNPFDPNANTNPFGQAIDPFGGGGAVNGFGGFAPAPIGAPVAQGHCSPDPCAPCAPPPCEPQHCSPCDPNQGALIGPQGSDPFGFGLPNASGPVTAGSVPFGGLSGGGVDPAASSPYASYGNVTPDGWGNPFGAQSSVSSPSQPQPLTLAPGNASTDPFAR